MSREHTVTDGFSGALEELYVKNASAEHRTAYLYADDNRLMGTFLIDLTRAPGRALFSRTIADAPLRRSAAARPAWG